MAAPDQGQEKVRPERLIPVPIGGQPKEVLAAQEKGVDDLEELASIRQEALRRAPDLDTILREEREKKGTETSPNINLALEAVEDFQRIATEAQDFRRVVRTAAEPQERSQALIVYNQKKQDLSEYLKYGLSFEKAYREYIKSRNGYVNFLTSINELSRLEGLLEEPHFKSIEAEHALDTNAAARIEMVMRETEPSQLSSKKEREQVLASLGTVYAPESDEYKEVEKILSGKKRVDLPRTKRELMEEVERLKGDVRDSWEDSMVRYFWQRNEIDRFLGDFAQGEDVIETQSVIRRLNELHDWENHHPRTTIGGVLVGPPGVGKTTMIRHYLGEKDRNFVYIDLSEDVTRYLLYGSKSIEFKSPSEYYRTLVKDLEGMDDDEFKKFVGQNSHRLEEMFGLDKDEALVAAVEMIRSSIEEVSRSEEVSEETVGQLRGKVVDLAQKAFHEELGHEFAQLVKKNGWRDGVVIAALRRGDSVIMDEFNKNKNWSLIYGLMTAKPGESWYFADNDEHIPIPANWRMYFTANIGRKHGGFEVAEALASRAGGKVMEVEYPPSREEMYIALCALSNPEGDFLRSKDDLAKLFVTVHELFPKIRTFVEDKRQSIPVSYRTIRDIAEKLVLSHDPRTRKAIFAPTNKTFDEALYEVLVESYAVYEDKTVPKEIVNLATSVGLMLDDSVAERVIKSIGEDEFKKRKDTFEEHKEDFDEIIKKIRGLSKETSDMAIPASRQF